MKKVLLEQPVIQADKTTLTVNRDGSSVGISSYMWVYIYIIGEQDASGRKILLYDYCKIRSTSHLRDFLASYQGYCYLMGGLVLPYLLG